jgi:hypothetical protein
MSTSVEPAELEAPVCRFCGGRVGHEFSRAWVNGLRMCWNCILRGKTGKKSGRARPFINDMGQR